MLILFKNGDFFFVIICIYFEGHKTYTGKKSGHIIRNWKQSFAIYLKMIWATRRQKTSDSINLKSFNISGTFLDFQGLIDKISNGWKMLINDNTH